MPWSNKHNRRIDLIKGKTIEQAVKITEKELSDALGGPSTSHMPCSDLSMEAFKKSVNKYKEKKWSKIIYYMN